MLSGFAFIGVNFIDWVFGSFTRITYSSIILSRIIIVSLYLVCANAGYFESPYISATSLYSLSESSLTIS
jgi:hypothetical protein